MSKPNAETFSTAILQEHECEAINYDPPIKSRGRSGRKPAERPAHRTKVPRKQKRKP
jgi:hypothetical protein